MPRATATIRFRATLLRPAGANGRKILSWTFLMLPKEAIAKLPSRGQVTVEGALNGLPIRATLEPDGRGGHWLRVDRKVFIAAGASAKPPTPIPAAGDEITLEITPVAPKDEPEPSVPADLRRALAAAPDKARAVWADITPLARRDWVQWITSAKQAQTRARRITSACDMLAKGKRRPCCFDRSGMYGRNLRCPVPD
jgi:hypothetical protein